MVWFRTQKPGVPGLESTDCRRSSLHGEGIGRPSLVQVLAVFPCTARDGRPPFAADVRERTAGHPADTTRAAWRTRRSRPSLAAGAAGPHHAATVVSGVGQLRPAPQPTIR